MNGLKCNQGQSIACNRLRDTWGAYFGEKIMAGCKNCLAIVAGMVLLASSATAQNSVGPAPTSDAAVLSNLPKASLQPSSLFDPTEGFPLAKPDLPLKPYAIEDPLLDPSNKDAPGWFANVWLDVVNPRLINHLRGELTLADGSKEVITTGGVPLDVTLMPAIGFGHRWASGLGECSVLFRGMSTSGSATDGDVLSRSKLNLYVVEWNYSNDEFFAYPNWKFKPTLGLRYAWTYFDVTENASPNSSASFTDRKTTNLSYGIGPHAGLEMGRQIVQVPGLSVVGMMDICGTLGWGKQQALQFSTPAQGGANGEVDNSASSYFQILILQAGLGWQPPSMPEVQFFLGYTHESWWSVGIIRLSGASFSLDGISLRANIQF